jgi:hypothetical protein
MDAEQIAISQFLKSWPDQFVSRKEICRRAGGKWRFREDENWAVPVLQRMVEDRAVEADDTGHFRLAKEGSGDAKNKKALWIAPAFRAILQKSGREFGTIDLDKDPETAAQMTSMEPALNYHTDFLGRTTHGNASVH